MLQGWKYEATIVGQESDNVTHLSFVRFKTEREAQLWVVMMNRAHRQVGDPLTLFGYREIG